MAEKTMTPSETVPIIARQIGEIQDNLAAALRKSRLLSGPVQQVFEHQGDAVVAEMLAVIRKRVEAVSNLIVRHVKVDRSRTPQQVLDATGRRQYTDPKVVKSMPRGEGEEVEVFFFNFGRFASDEEQEKELGLRGLKAADPYSLAAVNEADSTFADDHPNCTHWRDANGEWCYTAFRRFYDVRHVVVRRDDYRRFGRWWGAGLPK